MKTCIVTMTAFMLSICIAGICFGGDNVKCTQKTGPGYTTCVDDGLGACTTATSLAVCGDTASGGDCKCGSTASGCLCGTNT